jgi:hypothetical protein
MAVYVHYNTHQMESNPITGISANKIYFLSLGKSSRQL